MNTSVCSDYRIADIRVLLDRDCILQRYYPLIPYCETLINNLTAVGCMTKSSCCNLTDGDLLSAGLPDVAAVSLFRRFLCLYDYKGRGIKDIPDADGKSDEEIASLLQLMRLPGVKATRAGLYYYCGLHALEDFAVADAEQLVKLIGDTISRDELPYTLPFPKELCTQIAVAKVFTEFAVV